jgi:hypothetical protein
VARRADVELLDTAHGVVAIVELASDALIADALAALPVAEQAHARTLTEVRRRELIAGRTTGWSHSGPRR